LPVLSACPLLLLTQRKPPAAAAAADKNAKVSVKHTVKAEEKKAGAAATPAEAAKK
jgi:hypothetical protein